MFEVVDWGLPKGGLASNTVKSQDRVFSVQIPRDPLSLEVKVDGDMTEQAHSVFSQLKKSTVKIIIKRYFIFGEFRIC